MSTSKLISRAQTGDMQARLELSIALIQGKGIKKDTNRGMAMLQRLVDQDYEPAMELFEELADCRKEVRKKLHHEDQFNAYLRQNNLVRVKTTPPLITLQTVGFRLYGCSKVDLNTLSHEATHYFVILYLPVFPTARYRVISDGRRSYRFLGRASLEATDWIPLFLWMIFILLVAIFK